MAFLTIGLTQPVACVVLRVLTHRKPDFDVKKIREKPNHRGAGLDKSGWSRSSNRSGASTNGSITKPSNTIGKPN